MFIFKTDGSYGKTTQEWKNWLSTHNVEVYYALATPIEIEITDPTLLAQLNALEQITQYKHTYITITGDGLTPEADFTYINNVVINNTDSVLGKDTYWNDEVPTQQDLPSNAQEGEIRIVQDTEEVYIYNGTKWVPFDKNSEVDLSNYLTKDNTTPWVPTGPFNPSTKKYVDDSVGGIHVPTKTSQLQNDSGFVIKTTNELTNYYTKNNTYTKNEVDALVAGGSGTSDYSDLTNKPKINNVELSGNKSLSDLGITNFSGDYNDLSNKPTIPTALSELSSDESHRVVTDIEKSTWNNKSSFSGNYNDLSNKPTIPTVPTNVSAFINDAGYLTEHQDLSGKQDKLVSGQNIKTINNKSLLGSGNLTVANVYSMEETVIGTWVDGKPIYRKVFSVGGSTSQTISTFENKIKDVINKYGFVQYENKMEYFWTNLGETGFIATIDQYGINVTLGTKQATGSGYLVIEYTKSTD